MIRRPKDHEVWKTLLVAPHGLLWSDLSMASTRIRLPARRSILWLRDSLRIRHIEVGQPPALQITSMPKFLHAEPEQWYGIALAALVISWVLARFFYWAGPRLFAWIAFYVTRPLVPRKLLDRFAHLKLFGFSPLISFTMFEVGLALYAISNAVIMSLHVENRAHVGARSGILATINMTPLLTGTRLSGIADILGISLRTQATIHRWVGCVTVVTSVIHVVITMLEVKLSWSMLEVCGTIVSA